MGIVVVVGEEGSRGRSLGGSLGLGGRVVGLGRCLVGGGWAGVGAGAVVVGRGRIGSAEAACQYGSCGEGEGWDRAILVGR